MDNIVFSEKQRFNNKWLWIAIGMVLTIPIVIAIYDRANILVSLLITIPALALLLAMQLRTEIGEEGICVKFFPMFFLDKIIKWEEIEKVYPRKYKPISEYGGWGIRITLKNGIAYNVRGNKGIQIIFKDGKKLLIGTQKYSEAEQALAQFRHKLNPESTVQN